MKLEAERRKVMDAYYKGAIDIDLLRSEQERITGEAHEVEGLLAALTAEPPSADPTRQRPGSTDRRRSRHTKVSPEAEGGG
ncbi:MAG TPA: hypothetical protein VN193_02615 [Candidatus Angelobacter sp.]|nr:hypothetical protein [Candidatus Angelobacter sp.]